MLNAKQNKMQKVLAHTIIIDRAGGKNFFQIRLPQDIRRIIGIETGLLVRNPMPILPYDALERFRHRRNILIGRLKLQLLNHLDFFYSKDIIDRDSSEQTAEIEYIPQIDEKLGTLLNPPIINNWEPFRWIYAPKREEDTVICEGTTVVKGIYEDVFARDYGLSADYTISIFLWYET